MTKCFEIGLKRFRRQVGGVEGVEIVLIAVEPLPAVVMLPSVCELPLSPLHASTPPTWLA